VQRALLDMSTTAQIKDSLKLGSVLLGEIGNMAKLHKPAWSRPALPCSRRPTFPACWWKPPSSATPGRSAAHSAYQEQLADALMRGIVRYFAKNPPLARSRTV
jgi:N-acetylmuramoyl-L-alanine amidase